MMQVMQALTMITRQMQPLAREPGSGVTADRPSEP